MIRAIPLSACLAILVGCATSHEAQPAPDGIAVARLLPSANARKNPKFANVQGDIKFIQRGDTTQVVAIIQGLPPNGSFGFHIHTVGDLSDPDLKSAGKHWDPAMKKHHGAEGDPDGEAGDMGNVHSDANGVAKVNFTTKFFSVAGEPSVIGHAVILHADPDDLTSQPAGNSGPRIAGGVIFKQPS
jgi:Cu-Zn family superoxide dismutase